jgi:predicted RNA-binding Zn-ribbon protein involved in translation (DUF1610 family)
MKTKVIRRLIFGALLCTGLIATAVAGPGPREVFTQVKTVGQAANIQPGQVIAFACGNCGTMSVTVAGKDRSYLRSYTCPLCKKKFIVRDNGHGEAGGALMYESDDRRIATLYEKH